MHWKAGREKEEKANYINDTSVTHYNAQQWAGTTIWCPTGQTKIFPLTGL